MAFQGGLPDVFDDRPPTPTVEDVVTSKVILHPGPESRFSQWNICMFLSDFCNVR
jgi:hypothetical protein